MKGRFLPAGFSRSKVGGVTILWWILRNGIGVAPNLFCGRFYKLFLFEVKFVIHKNI